MDLKPCFVAKNLNAIGYLSPMKHLFLAEAAKRELPTSSIFYGVFAFTLLALGLYLVLRLDND